MGISGGIFSPKKLLDNRKNKKIDSAPIFTLAATAKGSSIQNC
jgi:hypothetical protein